MHISSGGLRGQEGSTEFPGVVGNSEPMSVGVRY